MTMSNHRRLVCAIILLVHLSFSVLSDELRQLSATDWWQHAGFYQIYPRSYKDSNGDGIGDLKGITEKLPYLKEIGVHAFWLSPIYKSPMADFGYDISDFKDVHPDFGTMADFENMVKEANKLGLKVILDFVPNHSSDDHEWFKKSENKVAGFEDYYVWHDGIPGRNEINDPPNNWAEAFRGSAWQYSTIRKQYYLHQFHRRQPDLNYRNPKVVAEMKDVLRFWLDKGVNGFRVDAVPWLFEDEAQRDEPASGDSDDPLRPEYYRHIYTQDLPETVDMVYQWRKVLDDYKTEHGGETRILMTEAWSGLPIVSTYFQDENSRQGSQMPFNFQLIMNLNENSKASDFKHVIDNWLNAVPAGHTPNWVLGNHDKRRVASRMGGEHMIDIMGIIELSLPGVSVTYQGEEIGMLDYELSWADTQDPAACQTNENDYQKYTRDPSRTPFQWDGTSNAGFTTNTKPWLPVNPNYVTVNVKSEQEAEKSHLKIFMELMKLRNEESFQNCAYETKDLGDVFAVIRIPNKKQASVTLANLGSSDATVDAGSLFSTFKTDSYANFQVKVASLNSARSIGDAVDITNVILKPHEAILVTNGVVRHLAQFMIQIAAVSLMLCMKYYT